MCEARASDARPFLDKRRDLGHHVGRLASIERSLSPQPVGERRPGVLYGLGNLVENAVDFARERVEISAKWSARHVTIEIADDGSGVPADVMDALGEPYITTRPARPLGQIKDGEPSGLGLGFFIAKTLLERSGATVTLDNRKRPEHGAIVKISWQRDVFERKQATMPAAGSEGIGLQLTDADGGIH